MSSFVSNNAIFIRSTKFVNVTDTNLYVRKKYWIEIESIRRGGVFVCLLIFFFSEWFIQLVSRVCVNFSRRLGYPAKKRQIRAGKEFFGAAKLQILNEGAVRDRIWYRKSNYEGTWRLSSVKWKLISIWYASTKCGKIERIFGRRSEWGARCQRCAESARAAIELASELACAQIVDFYLEIGLEIEFSSLLVYLSWNSFL